MHIPLTMKAFILLLICLSGSQALIYYEFKENFETNEFFNFTYIKPNKTICANKTFKDSYTFDITNCKNTTQYECFKNDVNEICFFKNTTNHLVIFDPNISHLKYVEHNKNIVSKYNDFIMKIYIFYNNYMTKMYNMKKILIQMILNKMRHDELAFGRIFKKNIRTIFHTHDVFSVEPVDIRYDYSAYKNISFDEIKSIRPFKFIYYNKINFEDLIFADKKNELNAVELNKLHIAVSSYINMHSHYEKHQGLYHSSITYFQIFIYIIGSILVLCLIIFILNKVFLHKK